MSREIGWYSSTLKSTVQDEVRVLSDTVLYEEARKAIKQVEQNKLNMTEPCHWINSIIYTEFWRRDKPGIWDKAFNSVQEELGASKRIRN